MTARPTPPNAPDSPEVDDFFEDDFLDEIDDPPKRTKKKGPSYTDDALEEMRDKLFVEGSSYKETPRDQIVGIENVLVEVDDIIHWLRHSKDYQKQDARLEPGVIFEGDPGTGKTLVSRYVASASDAFFINVRDFPHNGSLFKDSDISDLFRRAREAYKYEDRPVVLFWDEFENGAWERSSGGTTPEQAATVSQLTAELDGIHGKNEGILLIGCTNYIYGIDAALRRSGRLGLQIEFHAPDRVGKKLLLEHYLSKYTTQGKIDVDTLSYFFVSNDTAADIEESCMEAWRYAVKRSIENGVENASLSQDDLIAVFLKRLVGPPVAFVNLPFEQRARVAVHEVGHAIMALVYEIPLRLITVQPGKKSLGRTIATDVNEFIGSLDEMVSDIRVSIGSIAAERAAGLPLSNGATADVGSVTRTATKLVDDLHAGSLTGLFRPSTAAEVRIGGNRSTTPTVSPKALEDSDADVKTIIKDAERDADKVMAAIGRDRIWAIANAVNEEVTLTGTDFETLFQKIAGEPTQFRAGDALVSY